MKNFKSFQNFKQVSKFGVMKQNDRLIIAITIYEKLKGYRYLEIKFQLLGLFSYIIITFETPQQYYCMNKV